MVRKIDKMIEYDDMYADEEDVEDDDDSTELLACPECGADVYEEAQRCPSCGNYIVHDSNVWSGRPAWWIVLGLLGIVMTIVVLALGSLIF